MHLAGAVGGQDHQRRGDRPGRCRARGSVIVKSREHLQQERLELVVGPVDLVDEQHAGRRRSSACSSGRASEEAPVVELRLERRRRRCWRAGGLGGPQVQQLAGEVPVVERLARRRGPRSTAAGMSGRPVTSASACASAVLPDARLALQEERAVHDQRQVGRRREPLVGEVARCFSRAAASSSGPGKPAGSATIGCTVGSLTPASIPPAARRAVGRVRNAESSELVAIRADGHDVACR